MQSWRSHSRCCSEDKLKGIHHHHPPTINFPELVQFMLLYAHIKNQMEQKYQVEREKMKIGVIINKKRQITDTGIKEKRRGEEDDDDDGNVHNKHN